MGRCKEIDIRVIPASVANMFVKKHHYSGKVVPNSCLHFGAFLDGHLHGVLQYGPSMDKRQTIRLVEDTKWNEFLELNRMAFDDYLPRNSESYCIGATLRMIKKKAPHIKWVISFADGCSCGDGTIYRASNFVLTQIKKNNTIRVDENGNKISSMTITAHTTGNKQKELKENTKTLDGYMFRYIYFLDKKCREKLTCEILPFSEIDKIGAGMYKGEKCSQAERHEIKTEKHE